MRRSMVVLLFLILLTIPLYSQQSSAASSDSTISFTAREWADFEAQVQAELERTALEAAEEAVKPHLVYEATLKDDLATEVCRKKAWRAAGIAGWILAIIASAVAVLK